MSSHKFPSYLTYYALMAMLVIFMIVTDLSTSILASSIQTQKFLDDESIYASDIKSILSNSTSTNIVTDSIQGIHDGLSIMKALGYVFSLVFGSIPLIIFIIMYKKSGQELKENKYEPHIRIANTTSFTLLIALFFSVGLSFYFTAYSSIAEYQQMYTITLSDIHQDNVNGKMGLLKEYMSNNSGKYFTDMVNADYFFEIFIFLIIGIFIQNKNFFFSKSLFVGALCTTLAWLISFVLIPVIPLTHTVIH